MADNTLVNGEGLLTTSPSIFADIANDPAEDNLLASDDEDISCGQMSTERHRNTNLQENGISHCKETERLTILREETATPQRPKD